MRMVIDAAASKKCPRKVALSAGIKEIMLGHLGMHKRQNTNPLK